MSGNNDGPQTSEYQSTYAPDTVYQPNVNTSDSDETAAQSTYQKVYGTSGKPSSDDSGSKPTAVNYPTLKMAYTTAPHLEGLNPPSGSQDSSSSSAPELNSPISINLASLRETENSFLTATKALIDDYENTLVPEIKSAMASTTLFGQNVTMPRPDSGTGTNGEPGLGDNTFGQTPSMIEFDPLDDSGTQFAATINPEMSQLLQSVGDVIELLGQFTAAINQAGQLYAIADRNSAFPPPGELTGPVVHSEGMNGRPNVHKSVGMIGPS